jgi:DNA-nicking Smr family endonuclease
VLKEELKTWLTRDPLKRVVLAFVTALPRHGGAGALYVLLRKYKKIKGKVRWENFWDSLE